MTIRKILIVDDSPTDRHILANILTKCGYLVDIVECGEEGIAMASEIPPDLILMDVVMPGISGFQATRTLSKGNATKNIPIILCTTKGQPTDKIWGLRQGARDYITKPIVEAELLQKILKIDQSRGNDDQ